MIQINIIFKVFWGLSLSFSIDFISFVSFFEKFTVYILNIKCKFNHKEAVSNDLVAVASCEPSQFIHFVQDVL